MLTHHDKKNARHTPLWNPSAVETQFNLLSTRVWIRTHLIFHSTIEIFIWSDHIDIRRANKVTEVRCCLFTKSMVLSDTNSIPS